MKFLGEVLIDMMNELASECYIAGFSETQNATVFQYAVTGVKDKLLEEWLFLFVLFFEEMNLVTW